MLHLHFSNRIEALTDDLADRVAGPRADPFVPDTVLIPHSGAKRHLQIELAQREGVCANLSFEYLAQWLWAQVARVLPQVTHESPFDAASLTWRVYAVFQDADFVRGYSPLAAYLASGHADPVVAYELAAATAALMEQYITYRPDWLARWQADAGDRATGNAHEPWQAAAWARVASGLALQGAHPIEAMARELERAGDQASRGFGLPAAAHIWALPAVPPLYLQALHSLARFMDLHVYALNPCRQFWFDLVDPRQLDRLEAAGQGEGREVGHVLLSSWGKQAQSALGLLTGIDESELAAWVERYEPSGRATLLGRLQDMILDLGDLAPGSLPRAPDDRSIEVHVAHSLTRELEVLHDRLLGLFRDDATLRPSDILVVTPDLEAAAPLIEGVFGTAAPARFISYAMTGRRRSSVNAPVKAFLQLLALASSRCTASEVFGLLQQPVVCARFGLGDDELQQVHAWLIAAGFHWGLDAAHVAAHELPAHVAHTMADALSRLFLGYALADGESEPFAGHLPRGDAEGSASTALGALWRFASLLGSLVTALRQARPADAWARLLHQVREDFILPDPHATTDWLELAAGIDSLARAVARAGFEGEVAAPIVRTALERELEDSPHGGAPTGRVTFTGMNSLRNLPFRVVCAIGMNHGAFPTADKPSEIDLMATAPRAGDRQRRTDQRTLFLDLLLSARDVLHLSYAGHSIRDNSVTPPSVLVSELLDVLLPATADKPEALVVRHPLQPFSPDAFDESSADPRVRSFDADLAQSLRAGLLQGSPLSGGDSQQDNGDGDGDEAREPARLFFAQPLADPGPQWRTVSAGQLIEFFSNPSRYLLRRRMGLELPGDEDELRDDEPFVPDFEGRSALADRLLPDLLRGIAAETARRLAEAGTEMPPGAMGQGELDAELASLQAFADTVRRESAAAVLPPLRATLDISLDGEAWRVEEPFADLRAQGLVRWRYDDERAQDVLRAWITHLVICATAPEGVVPHTAWVARSAVSRYAAIPQDEARRRLAVLLRLYREGLTHPLAFFPKTSRAYFESGDLRQANKAWQGSAEFPGEYAKPGYALAWRGVSDPLGGRFQEIAGEVFGDMPVTSLPFTAEAGA
ncbi:exodeoxyribonuclease V subunit gamma [Sphaerotilaceae bacterium SBD11-9]